MWRERSWPLRSRNPSKIKRSVGRPLITNAMIKAAGPGIAETMCEESIAARTKREPGSLIPGVPASVTRQTSRPSLRASRTRGIELCSVCSSTRIKVALIPRLCSSKPVRRVSSQQTKPARVSASMARGEISPIFPSGVATKIN